MAAITQYQPYGLPGQKRSFIAKVAAVTTLLNYVGATGKVVADYPPAHIVDSGDSLLILDSLEVRGAGWLGGATNYAKIDSSGNFKHFGTSKFLNLTWDIETFTTDDTLDAENVTVLLDGSSNSVTASLPTAVGIVGRVYYIKSIDATNTTDINPNGSQTIDGDSINLVLAEDASVTIISDNSNWQII